MRKIEGVNWMEAYQAYCLSGLGLRGFITQEMYKFCSDEKIPSRGSVIRYFSEIKRQLENANTCADAETVRVCSLDDQQLQDPEFPEKNYSRGNSRLFNGLKIPSVGRRFFHSF